MKIEAGKRYLRQDGKITGEMVYDGFSYGSELFMDKEDHELYQEDGRYYNSIVYWDLRNLVREYKKIDESKKAMNGFENIKERVELREKFKNETGDNWENSQGEPDIDYVLWLESKLLALPNVVCKGYQFYCSSFEDGEWRCETQCLGCAELEEQAKQ